MSILGPNRTFWRQSEFSFKIENKHFKQMYTACHQVQFMKKRFEEELKKVDFGAKK